MNPGEGRDLDASVDWVLPGEEISQSQIHEVNAHQGEILTVVKPKEENKPAVFRIDKVVVKGMPAPKKGK